MALSVYNALNGTNYTNPDDIEICTLDKGVSLTVRNDAAFVVDAALSIYEHQSTVCPNMLVRNLIYYTTIISKFVKKKNICGRTLVKIPVPKFVVFYNGDEDQPAECEMRLSDAFEKKTDNPELELVCNVYNINFGKNQQLLEKCEVLKQYMTFVDYVKYYLSQQDDDDEDDLKKAINMAIDRCIEDGVLVEFLMENRSEVVKVTQMDYTFDRQIIMEREAGREEGEMINLISQCCKKYKKGLAPEVAAEHLEQKVDLIKKIYAVIEAIDTQDAEKIYQYLANN
ncbi:MAG: hypothetical protein SOT58_06790 [Agathobacter sp.]|nr:hypothetical protein [Agathobacter sp.]